jgi:hypothetical protein
MNTRLVDVPDNAIRFKLRLKLVLGEGNQVTFLIDFVNDSKNDEELLFSENISEAARLALCISSQGKIIEPAEYRQAIRKSTEIPRFLIKSGKSHRFSMHGTYEEKVLRFGKTAYILKPDKYIIKFIYDGCVSNEVEWLIER